MKILTSIAFSVLLASAFFIGITVSVIEYDPIYDVNGDGFVGIDDIVTVAEHFSSSGTPINWTQLLNDIETLKSRLPQKGYVSVSPVAFDERYPTNISYITGHTWANLQLPHGVTLTNMTAFLRDNSGFGEGVTLELWGFNRTSDTYLGIMANVSTGGLLPRPEVRVFYDDTIDFATIDNKHCQYALKLTTENLNMWLKGVVIEYEYPA